MVHEKMIKANLDQLLLIEFDNNWCMIADLPPRQGNHLSSTHSSEAQSGF